jgi:hypothetical protein
MSLSDEIKLTIPGRFAYLGSAMVLTQIYSSSLVNPTFNFVTEVEPRLKDEFKFLLFFVEKF